MPRVSQKRLHNSIPKICKICGDKASGVNFNVLTCMSCKAFFRRNALVKNHQTMNCPFENKCELTKVTRKFCPKCRLRKCFDTGMVKEWILSDEEKQQKKEVRLQRQHVLELEAMQRLSSTTTTDTSNDQSEQNSTLQTVKSSPDSPTQIPNQHENHFESFRTSSVICHATSTKPTQNIPASSTIQTPNGLVTYLQSSLNPNSSIVDMLNNNHIKNSALTPISEQQQQQQQQQIVYKPSTYIILEPFIL